MTEKTTIRPGYTEPLAEHELTSKIIGAAIEVHKELGPGFVESTYEASLCFLFDDTGVAYDCQLEVPVYFRGRQAGVHRLDPARLLDSSSHHGDRSAGARQPRESVRERLFHVWLRPVAGAQRHH
ncbi:GxxExxY protein [Myxococcota bacterium]